MTRHGERVHLDLFGPILDQENRKKYVMVVTDAWSKYTELAVINCKEANTVARAFFEAWVVNHGCPERLVTDKGRAGSLEAKS